ncbi:MAG: hypothetical protein ACR2PL_21325 [Dehalococcoidia bacterium]
MTPFTLDIACQISEDQRLLNGSRVLELEGTAGGYSLTLALVQPKEPEAPIVEGDLSLTGSEGELFASIESGRISAVVDDISGIELEALDLRLQIEGGEGAYAGTQGTVRLLGVLAGGEVDLQVQIEQTPPDSSRT